MPVIDKLAAIFTAAAHRTSESLECQSLANSQQSLAQLRIAPQKEWNNISQEVVKKLTMVGSLSCRYETVVAILVIRHNKLTLRLIYLFCPSSVES